MLLRTLEAVVDVRPQILAGVGEPVEGSDGDGAAQRRVRVVDGLGQREHHRAGCLEVLLEVLPYRQVRHQIQAQLGNLRLHTSSRNMIVHTRNMSVDNYVPYTGKVEETVHSKKKL